MATLSVGDGTLSMPNPCAHITRIEWMRARLHGTDLQLEDHLNLCTRKEVS